MTWNSSAASGDTLSAPLRAELSKMTREAHPIGAAERRKILATAEGRGNKMENQ